MDGFMVEVLNCILKTLLYLYLRYHCYLVFIKFKMIKSCKVFNVYYRLFTRIYYVTWLILIPEV